MGISINERKRPGTAVLTENKKAKKILTLIVVTFAVSMLPINIFGLVALYWQGVFFLKHFWILYNVLVIFTTANSAVNPVIYSIVSREFRRGCKPLLLRGKQKFRGGLSFRSTGFSRGSVETNICFYPKVWPKLKYLRETDV